MFESINGTFTNTIKENLETKDWEIKKLSELDQTKDYPVYGYLITKEGRYGRSVLIATDGFFIGLPTRYVEKFKELPIDEIEALKNGSIKLTNIRTVEAKNGMTTVFELR